MVGANLRDHPDNILRPNGLVDVWHRFVAGYETLGSEAAKRQELILCCVSLFTKFGWQGSAKDEAQHIYENIVLPLDSSISVSEFFDKIEGFSKRKVLQGISTLYMTPRLLHVWCWLEWWNHWSATIDVAQLYSSLPTQLKTWFADMFVYAGQSEPAGEVVRQLLGGAGPFSDPTFLNSEEGAPFFFKLAQSHPRHGLNYLQRTVGQQTREELLRLTDGRRYVVHALKRIAKRRDLFKDAARLLLKLAAAENERWDNHASGEFANLFSLSIGHASPTEADPSLRLPVLDEALQSGDQALQELGSRLITATR